MKLTLNNNYRSINEQHVKNKPLLKSPSVVKNNMYSGKKSGVSFTSAEKLFYRTVNKGITTYSNIDVISGKINETLGVGFFEELLGKAGLQPNGKSLEIKNANILTDIVKTIKYPFVDLIPDLINSISQKFSTTKEPIFKNRALKLQEEKAKNLVIDILDGFTNKNLAINTSNKGTKGFNIETCSNYFKEKAKEGITKTAANYSSRDERTLNRLSTGLISATYGGWDFYNISMLQKDDKKEAKKAQKSRFKQEMSRFAINAGATFFTLGALNKFTKNSMLANIGIIGLTAFLTEVITRKINNVPLIPLTPDQAAKIARKQKGENTASDDTNENNAKNLPLKGIHISNEKQVFTKFLSPEGSFKPLDVITLNNCESAINSKPKSNKLRNLAIGSFATASTIYLASSAIKGEFKLSKDIKSLYKGNVEKFDNFIKDGKVDTELMDKVKNLTDNFDEKVKKINIFDKFKKLITTRKKEINLAELKGKLEILKNTEEGSKISGLLDEYIDKISQETDDVIKVNQDTPVLLGIYEGFSKIFKTVYQVLSLPGLAVKGIINKTVYNKPTKIIDKVKAYDYKSNTKKELLTLNNIIDKCTKKYPSDQANKKAIEIIAKNVRNFSDAPETGELANYARTCVTVISSWFFINDYKNRVLIESEGKDVQKAREEGNQRLVQKLANFVINGTLMNLFNSILKTPLNKNLFWASIIPAGTETTNEFLVRKMINSPILPKKSKQEIIDFDKKQESKKGVAGWWAKTYKKLTGKKSLTEKAGVDKKDDSAKKA